MIFLKITTKIYSKFTTIKITLSAFLKKKAMYSQLLLYLLFSKTLNLKEKQEHKVIKNFFFYFYPTFCKILLKSLLDDKLNFLVHTKNTY